ncbi:hypothetical protein [Spirosoma foliorum]|uniref:Uncharacterized protein n=1 Tax=Spirosoma foliorum TaxID=2710596 RepID=A0A7G5H2H2_9BACT|nr:hypothetical protein [Spirosoma foliorum]QMW05314.1 hypothetical protein H3H32_10715 [Spirosoma foliorum]
MKRRNFFGSLFAAGAVIKNSVPIVLGKDTGKSAEVVTPVDRLKFDFEGALSAPVRTMQTHIKVSSTDLFTVLDRAKKIQNEYR